MTVEDYQEGRHREVNLNPDNRSEFSGRTRPCFEHWPAAISGSASWDPEELYLVSGRAVSTK